MEKYYFEMQWPRDNLFIDCFAHEITHYYYHWHPDMYELSILLHGGQEFCCGTESAVLEEDDVILISPNVGHASFAQCPNTRALVLHFSSKAFKPFVKKGCSFAFPSCRSTAENRNEERFQLIRFYAAQVFDAIRTGGPYSQLKAKASMEMLLATLCCLFTPQLIDAKSDQDEEQQEVVRRLITYIEEHYNEKLTLENLAQVSQYNRTYVSTLFKNTVGVNFYEYLTRVRFQRALSDLAIMDKQLTDIALSNGFSDLKSFNKRFKDTLHRTPTEYRAQLGPSPVPNRKGTRIYIPASDTLVSEKVTEYIHLPNLPRKE